MPKKRFYTGVGSRKTPEAILFVMTRIALFLNKSGYTLRSGGADGADAAFEKGAGQLKQIYRPEHATPEAMGIASSFHPAWHRCSDYAKRLHGRNAFQVLGLNLNEPSEFLLCWTPDACLTHAARSFSTGGTGTAISIANAYNVPVNNLARIDHLDYWNNLLKGA